MTHVVDASFVAKIYLPDENATDEQRRQFDAAFVAGVVVPALFPFEVANIFLMAERRNRLTPAEASAVRDAFDKLRYVVEPPPTRERVREVLRLAVAHRLTAYDAAYLELAIRVGATLASVDMPLVAAAQAASLPTVP